MNLHDKFEDLAYVYSIGALDGEDIAIFEKHLDSGCDLCSKILKDNSEVVSVIPYSTDLEIPPAHLERRIMNSISKAAKSYDYENEYKPSFWQRISPAWYGFSTAFAVLLLIISVSFIYKLKQEVAVKDSRIASLSSDLEVKNNELESLKSRVANSELELASIKAPYEKYGEVTNYLQDPDVVIINLVSLLPEIKAVGRILWETKDNELIFVSSNLPEAPPGKIYQMWLIADGTPKSVGIFNVGVKEKNIVDLGKLSDVKNIKTFAVTLEPDGGVPLPTGQMYLAGDV